MSVTRWLKETKVREFLKGLIDVPKVDVFPAQVVPLQTSDPARMGSAVDYGIRMRLARKYRATAPEPWVATLSLEMGLFDVEQTSIVRQYIMDCVAYFNMTQKVDREFVERCWALAALDIVYRVGVVPANLIDYPTKDEIDEFKKIFAGVVKAWPAPKEYCVLNPTFGAASYLTGGADADVIQDGMIIDIKTINVRSKKPPLLDHILQLVMYAALARMQGKYDITKVGIYFARHHHLLDWPLSDIVLEENLVKIQDYIAENAEVGVVSFGSLVMGGSDQYGSI